MSKPQKNEAHPAQTQASQEHTGTMLPGNLSGTLGWGCANFFLQKQRRPVNGNFTPPCPSQVKYLKLFFFRIWVFPFPSQENVSHR